MVPLTLARFSPDGSIGGNVMRLAIEGDWLFVGDVETLIERMEKQHKLEMDKLRAAFSGGRLGNE